MSLLVGAIMLAWNNPMVAARQAVKQAAVLLHEGNYTQAVSLLEDTLPTYDSPELRLNLSYAYLARRDADRALKQARAVVSAAPIELRTAATVQLGRSLFAAGRPDDALTTWQQAIESAKLDLASTRSQQEARSAQWHISMLFWGRADWPASQGSLKPLIGGQDIYARSAAFKFAQLLAPTDPQEAVDLLTSARVVTTTVGGVPIPDLRVLGLDEGLRPQQIEAASSVLTRTLTLASDPGGAGVDEASSALLWGGYYLQQGELLLAREYLTRAITLQPGSASAHARLALGLLSQGEIDSALAQLQAAVILDPVDPLPHYALVQIYTGRRDWAAVQGEFALLRRLRPNSIELLMQTGEYYRLQGEYEKAEQAYTAAVSLQEASPSAVDAPQLVADPALTLARYYTDSRGLGCERGVEAGRQAAAIHPNDPAALDAVGWALVICHNAKDALPAMEQAVKGAPEISRYRYHLAKAYVQLGRIKDARTQYAKVINLDPGGAWEKLSLTDLSQLPRE